MLHRDSTALILIDIQEKLAPHMAERDVLIKNTTSLLAACKILGIPVLVTEQYPEGIGPTLAPLLEHADNALPISKRTFSCWREPRFMDALQALNRRQIMLCGIETHVCVYQTAADLISQKYSVHVVADAVSSRSLANKTIGLERMRACGADIASVESVLFELLATSACPEFRPVVKLIK